MENVHTGLKTRVHWDEERSQWLQKTRVHWDEERSHWLQNACT